MIDRIALFITEVDGSGNVYYSRNVNLPRIAELLGLNLDVENGILYAGDNKNNGFSFDITSDTQNLFLYHYVNGAKNTTYHAEFYNCCTNQYLYFLKNENGCVFGVGEGETPVIKYGVGTATKMDGSKIVCYLSCSIRDNQCMIFSEDGLGGYLSTTTQFCQSYNVVSLAPSVFTPDNAVLDDFFVPAYFSYSINCQEFEMGSNKYLTFSYLNSDNASYTRFIFKE